MTYARTPAEEQLRVQLANSLIKHLTAYHQYAPSHDADVRDAVLAATRDWEIRYDDASDNSLITVLVPNEEVI